MYIYIYIYTSADPIQELNGFLLIHVFVNQNAKNVALLAPKTQK